MPTSSASTTPIPQQKLPPPTTLYYAGPLETIPDFSPILTSEGHLLIAGGLTDGSNFTPTKNVYLLKLDKSPAPAEKGKADLCLILSLTGGAFLLIGIALLVYFFINKRHPTVSIPEERNYNALLLERIRKLMEEDK